VDYLLDTNLLLRLVDSNAPQHATAAKAIAFLKSSDNRLFNTPDFGVFGEIYVVDPNVIAQQG
jgi:predicted nucleic acid-binding protein